MDSAYVGHPTIWKCLGLRVPFRRRRRPAHNRKRCSLVARPGDRANELVSPPGDIDDEPIPVASITQRAPQCRNMDGQIGRLDKDIGPNAIHQFLLADQLTWSFKQRDQDFQSATPKAHWLVAFEQKKLGREQAERPECNFARCPDGGIGPFPE
jgi:hypothetical protein